MICPLNSAVIDGDPNHASTRLNVYEKEDGSRRGTCTIAIWEEMLYLA